ncbi:hypothetical protein C7999DRAFT_31013 [Corynascus novoguineensis]|uniref:Uncharacterized protein n=1 Tax=Corynascus novoguineensis TaxID=1126955 RepID=A0AAN7HG64_9PEZI|nr:hypothetical protein C7999DRAFT_31013 [Corynascus novoguineensis]
MARRRPQIQPLTFDHVKKVYGEWQMDVVLFQSKNNRIQLRALASYEWEQNWISRSVADALTSGFGIISKPGDSFGSRGRVHHNDSVSLWAAIDDDDPILVTFRIIEDDSIKISLIMGLPAIWEKWPDLRWPRPNASPATPMLAPETNTVPEMQYTFRPPHFSAASQDGNGSLTFGPALEEPSDGQEAIQQWLTDPTYPFSQCKNKHAG